jgi:hypothetical protein
MNRPRLLKNNPIWRKRFIETGLILWILEDAEYAMLVVLPDDRLQVLDFIIKGFRRLIHISTDVWYRGAV